MMNKLIIITILFCSVSLFAGWDAAESNPASVSQNDQVTFSVPGLNNQLNANNSLLRIDDLIIFDKNRIDNGHVLSDTEMDILTAKDLSFGVGADVNIFELGIRNFKLSINSYAVGKGDVLDKDLVDLILGDNETNVGYKFDTGENSKAFAFVKTSIDYAWHKPFDLRKNWEPTGSNFINDILNPTLYVGGRLSLYNSANYAEVSESSIEFGSMEDSLYYDYYMKYAYTSEAPKSIVSPGFGIGAIAEYENAKVSLMIDDIFTKLYFQDLKGGEYEGQFADSLLFFHSDDYEPFDESNENDSLKVARKSITLKPSIEFSVQSNVWKKLDLTLKYQYSDYKMLNRFSFTSDYTVAKVVPLRFTTGYDKQMYYHFATGIKSRVVDFYLGYTFHHGFFRYMKGFGLETGLKFRI